MAQHALGTVETTASGFITGVEFIRKDTKEKFCKFKKCRKRLSIYNFNRYCFVHSIAGLRLEDHINQFKRCPPKEKGKSV